MKKLQILLVLLFFFSIPGCVWDPVRMYNGEQTDLMATAVQSIPGCSSAEKDQVLVLEEDAYGRTLFAVRLQDTWLIQQSYYECTIAVLVMQSSTESQVAFFPDRNFLISSTESLVDITEELISKHFSDEAICQLKQDNDWDIPPKQNDVRLTTVSRTVAKEEKTDAAQKTIEAKIGTNCRISPYRVDMYGRHAYFVFHIEDYYVYSWYLVLLDDKGELFGRNAVLDLDETDVSKLPEDICAFLESPPV